MSLRSKETIFKEKSIFRCNSISKFHSVPPSVRHHLYQMVPVSIQYIYINHSMIRQFPILIALFKHQNHFQHPPPLTTHPPIRPHKYPMISDGVSVIEYFQMFLNVLEYFRMFQNNTESYALFPPTLKICFYVSRSNPIFKASWVCSS